MSQLFISRTCMFCKTPFEYPKTSPRCLCVPCASNHRILEEHVRQQIDFKLRLGMQVYQPIYWAAYNIQNISCWEMVAYHYKGEMRIGRVGSIHINNGTLFVRPLPSVGENAQKFIALSHEIAWESILCALRPLCS